MMHGDFIQNDNTYIKSHFPNPPAQSRVMFSVASARCDSSTFLHTSEGSFPCRQYSVPRCHCNELCSSICGSFPAGRVGRGFIIVVIFHP